MRYKDAASFRQALEERLRDRTRSAGGELVRNRKRVAFDRFLARLVVTAPSHWVLKGQFALDLRLADHARTTRDIDLDWLAAEDELLETLLDTAAADTGDYFSFQVERSVTPPDRLGGSHRFSVTAVLAGRTFDSFVLDVGLRADPITEPESVITTDLLAFAWIEPVTIPVMPLELQVAEKLHAYTRRYQGPRPSTRVKDLIDHALIAKLFPLDAPKLRKAISVTFSGRGEHEQPKALPAPPAEWSIAYRELATAVGISTDLSNGYATASALLDPILTAMTTDGSWAPEVGLWQPDD